MEDLGLRGRISTRAGIVHSRSSSGIFHSVQGASNPSTPADTSAEADNHRFLAASSTSSISSALMSFGLQSSPSSSNLFQFSNFHQESKGQFSDADTDDECVATEYPDRKRPRRALEVKDYNQQNNREDSVFDVSIADSPLLTSNHESKKSNFNSPETTSSVASTTQLPMATRRLAMLVGIPESSQAIIQSTLSLPSGRSSSINSGPCLNRARSTSESGNQEPTPSSSTSKPTKSPNTSLALQQGPGNNLFLDNQVENNPKMLNPKSPQVLDKPNYDTYDHPAQSPAAFQDSEALSPDLRGTDDFSRSRSLLAPSLIANKNVDVPPRFARSSESANGFIMPAPGTFSIRAPSSLDLLQRLGGEIGSTGLAEWSAGGALETENCQEASAIGNHEQSSSGSSIKASGSNSALIDQAQKTSSNNNQRQNSQTQSRKPRSESISTTASESREEVKLVRPPPTINGKISHSRKVPPGYVKRTPNSFIMFRSHVIANKLLPPGLENDNRQISRVVSGLWAGLSEDDLRTWQEASRDLRTAARLKNPHIRHTPNQRRKDNIVRRRRTGQLPGETPEQRVEREKATAAAVAKVIIDSRGERPDKEKLAKLVELPSSASDRKKKSTKSSSLDISSVENRSKLRAPPAFVSSISTPAPASQSEYAESTLTTSPSADRLKILSCRFEGVAERDLGSGSQPTTPSLSICDTESMAKTSSKPGVNDTAQDKTQGSSFDTEWFEALLRSPEEISIQPRSMSSCNSLGQHASNHEAARRYEVPAESTRVTNEPSDKDLTNFCDLFGPEPSVNKPYHSPVSLSDETFRYLGLNAADFQLEGPASNRGTTDVSLRDSTILGKVSEESHGHNSTSMKNSISSSSNYHIPNASNNIPEQMSGSQTESNFCPYSTTDDSVVSLEGLSQMTPVDSFDFDSIINSHFDDF